MTTADILAVHCPPLQAARQRNLTRPISEAQPGGQGRPARAERREPRSGDLDGPAQRSYTPHNHEPATAPERWVEKVARSIKGSDTPHLQAAGEAERGRVAVAVVAELVRTKRA
jgi:hypothetical protein